MSNAKNPIIAPSVLGADFSNLQKEIKFCNDSEAEWLHLDIMDQQFVQTFLWSRTRKIIKTTFQVIFLMYI